MTKEGKSVALAANINQTEVHEVEASTISGVAYTSGSVRSVAVLILAILAVVFALYFGKEVVLPITLAVILKLLLSPVMRILSDRLRLPHALGALLVILSVFGAIAGVGFAISVPAKGWLQKAPESLPLLKEKLEILRQPLEYVQSGLKQLETLTGGGDEATDKTVTVQQPSQIGGTLASGSAVVLSRFFTTMILLFFMLASGDRLLRGFVEVLPTFSDKRQAVEIAAEIEQNITGYLLTITLMNGLVGFVTAGAMWACGLGTPLLWGTAAFLLNYVPILGPMAGIVMFFIAGILTLGWPWAAFLPAGLYLLIHLVEGETVTPMLLAKRFTLNPVLVIVSLFFWHFLWGIPGALLAVPILAIFKIICDRVAALKPLGHIIGA